MGYIIFQYLLLHSHQQEWCQICLILFIAFSLWKLYFAYLLRDVQTMTPLVWLHIYSTGVGYYCCPAAITIVQYSRKDTITSTLNIILLQFSFYLPPSCCRFCHPIVHTCSLYDVFCRHFRPRKKKRILHNPAVFPIFWPTRHNHIFSIQVFIPPFSIPCYPAYPPRLHTLLSSPSFWHLCCLVSPFFCHISCYCMYFAPPGR